MIKILNLFITYGDTFLPNPATYDELYYELIRVYKVFDDLYSVGEINNGLLIDRTIITTVKDLVMVKA